MTNSVAAHNSRRIDTGLEACMMLSVKASSVLQPELVLHIPSIGDDESVQLIVKVGVIACQDVIAFPLACAWLCAYTSVYVRFCIFLRIRVCIIYIYMFI